MLGLFARLPRKAIGPGHFEPDSLYIARELTPFQTSPVALDLQFPDQARPPSEGSQTEKDPGLCAYFLCMSTIYYALWSFSRLYA